MNRTSIEWVKNPDGTQGYTWNPITGCLNGCPYCYARRLANGRLKPLYLANTNIAIPADLDETQRKMLELPALQDPFYPRFWEERAREQFGAYTAGAEPKGIFVCDMGDLFGKGVPEVWIKRVLSHISMPWYKEHRFYLLTKQPQNLIKFSPFPENCWVGVTATDNLMFQLALHHLDDVKAKLRFVSFEPLLHRIEDAHLVKGFDWLIIGACTGTMRELLPLHHKTGLPMIKWRGNKWILSPPIGAVEEIVQAADKAGIPVFLKANLAPQFEARKSYPWATNALGFLRQEIPKEGLERLKGSK